MAEQSNAVPALPALAKLAIVIPVGPGDESWRTLLADLSVLPSNAEVCIVHCDAGTKDARDALAQSLPNIAAQSLLSARGRAVQQNAGVHATRNPWLWFVHADSRLTPATLSALARAIESNKRDCIGYFDLAFHDGPALMRLNVFGAWLRSRWLALPFGDQGLFMSRALFDRLGGFDESCAQGEDHALIWQARRSGISLHPARAPLLTSSRKYSEQGWLRTTAQHVAMTWRQARDFSRAHQ
jgi:rSAM/selenodomain-associated transferase 2